MGMENPVQKIVVTGTMVYGPASLESDIDIVMLSRDAGVFAGFREQYLSENQEHFDPFENI